MTPILLINVTIVNLIVIGAVDFKHFCSYTECLLCVVRLATIFIHRQLFYQIGASYSSRKSLSVCGSCAGRSDVAPSPVLFKVLLHKCCSDERDVQRGRRKSKGTLSPPVCIR